MNPTAPLFATLILSGFAAVAGPAMPEDFSGAGKSVAELLETGDASRFAVEMTPTKTDWAAIFSTNDLGEMTKSLADAAGQRADIERSARKILAKAGVLGVRFSRGHFRVRAVPPPRLDSFQLDPGHIEPLLDRLEIVLTPDSGGGDFTLALHTLIKFPGGWRFLYVVGEGPQWASFPASVADARTIREMAILDKARGYERLTARDDPALLALARAVVHFVRAQDLDVFQGDVCLTGDLLWTVTQQLEHDGRSRSEVTAAFKPQIQAQREFARSLLQQMNGAGIDLRDAGVQIDDCWVEHLDAAPSDSVVGLTGQQFTVKLAVKSARQAKTGAALSGNYYLTANRVMRFADEWRVMDNLHWRSFPAGVLTAGDAERMAFATASAESGILPAGTPAPDCEFTTLEGEKKMKLSDFRGQVVWLLFWDTACPGCQTELAALQGIVQAHPSWPGKVAVIPLSIDESLAAARTHIHKHGWTNTLNAWAGAGDFQSQPAAAFRIQGIPTSYLIDSSGKIAEADPPVAGIERAVESLLNSGPPSSTLSLRRYHMEGELTWANSRVSVKYPVEIFRDGDVVKLTQVTDDAASNYISLNYLCTSNSAVTYSQYSRDVTGVQRNANGAWNNGSITVSQFRMPSFAQLAVVWLMAGERGDEPNMKWDTPALFNDGPRIELHERPRVRVEAWGDSSWPDGFSQYSEEAANENGHARQRNTFKITSWTNISGVKFPLSFTGTHGPREVRFEFSARRIEPLRGPVDVRLPFRSVVTDWRPVEEGRLVTGCCYDVTNGTIFPDIIAAADAHAVKYIQARDWALSNPVKVGAANMGDPAPEISARCLDGSPFKLSALRGKFVVLDFWATTCGPCIGELPGLKQIYDVTRANNRVALIGMDMGDVPSTLKAFVKKHDMRWPQVILRDGFEDPAIRKYNFVGVPTIFVIGPDGRLLAKLGNVSLEYVERLLAGKELEAP